MSDNPLVTIVTPAFNAEALLAETAQSVLDQDYQNWEWIILDDRSTDDTVQLGSELAEQDTRIRFVAATAGSSVGAPRLRNQGIEEAQGEYLIFLDHDDLLLPLCLGNRVRYMTQNPSLGFAVFPMGRLQADGSTQGLVNRFEIDKNQYLNRFLCYEIPWQTSCPIWKLDYLNQRALRFDEAYHRLQDLQFHSLALSEDPDAFQVITGLPDCLYRMPDSQGTLTTERLNNIVSASDRFIGQFLDVNREARQQFSINLCHALLFHYRHTPASLFSLLKHQPMRLNEFVSKTKIMLFALFNLSRLTFIKGIGVSRLWHYLQGGHP